MDTGYGPSASVIPMSKSVLGIGMRGGTAHSPTPSGGSVLQGKPMTDLRGAYDSERGGTGSSKDGVGEQVYKQEGESMNG